VPPDTATATLLWSSGAAGASDGETLYVRALADYAPTEDSELSLYEGEVVLVLRKDPSGWWEGRSTDGRVGWFPSNFVHVKYELYVGWEWEAAGCFVACVLPVGIVSSSSSRVASDLPWVAVVVSSYPIPEVDTPRSEMSTVSGTSSLNTTRSHSYHYQTPAGATAATHGEAGTASTPNFGPAASPASFMSSPSTRSPSVGFVQGNIPEHAALR